MTQVPYLPEDVFLLILAHLHPWDMVRCRRVSRSWKEAFSKAEYLRVKLKDYMMAREVQELCRKGLLWNPADPSTDWLSIFDKVASRYFHLTSGGAREMNRYKMAPLEQFSHWYPVSNWDYHESQSGGRLYYENATHISKRGGKPYVFRSTLWSYDDGLLVFAPRESSPDVRSSKQTQISGPASLVALDIETGKMTAVPYAIQGRVIRNLRLKDETLIVEWAEKTPFHDLNDSEKVHRHFATCFDVSRQVQWGNEPNKPADLIVTFRSEWKMHFLGLPLNHRDRFFSTHTHQHYAIYFWQPNRSMYTGDEETPIESLFVWDISRPSSYRPSTDPAGKSRPNEESRGPHILSRFSFRALDFLGIRQHSNIALMSLHLDSASWAITVRENSCVAGQGYFDPAERLWCAKMTSFPFLGCGPHSIRLWDGNLPPYRGHCSMESAPVEDSEPWFLPIMDIVDPIGHVRFSLVETCFTGQYVENRKVVRMKAKALKGLGWVALADEWTTEVTAMGRIAGDERVLVGQNDRAEIVVLTF